MNKQQLIETKQELNKPEYDLTSYQVELIIPLIVAAYDKGREDAITKTQSLLFTENGFLKEEIDTSDLLNETEKLREKV